MFRLMVVLIGAAGTLAATAASALAVNASGMTEAMARVIVQFRDDAPTLRSAALSPIGRSTTRMLALAQRQGIAAIAGEAVSESMQVVFADGMSSEELAQRLALDPDVEFAEPDRPVTAYVAPNDPLYGPDASREAAMATGQWYLRAPTREVRSAIDAEAAWDFAQGSPAIVVAVIDTGIRFEHPDLGAILPGYDMITDAPRANDGDGRDADPSDPGTWLTQEEVSDPNGPFFGCAETAVSSSWHGTGVSSLIGALTDNGVGMASVGRNVRILPVRALGKCGGFTSDIVAGMRWAAGLSVPGAPNNPNPARVLNMSLGGEGACDVVYRRAITDISGTGAIIVASAGNSSGHAVGAPASCSDVIAVGGLRHFGTKVGFSDLGSQVTISAPAGNCVNVSAGSACLYPILTTSNSGNREPVSSSYTDSFNASLGTSFSAPLVSGTVALMLSARPSLTRAEVQQILQATASPFPASGSDSESASTPVPVCTTPQYDAQGNPVDQLECYCTTTTCGAGMLNAGAAVIAASVGLPSSEVQAQGLWWAAPAASESGWGINFAHQGDVIFATWFTYDASGKAWWLSMTAARTAANTYAGTFNQTRGPAFNAVPFDPAQVTATAVGDATLTFGDNDNATFRYTVNGVTQTKAITRQVFGPLPTCVYGLHPQLAAATHYQDLWWAAPAGVESGWGMNLTQQGNVIFATWFTYDTDGSPLWLVGTAADEGAGYSGDLLRTTGPAFNAVPFDPAQVGRTVVGTFSLSFADGNAGTFRYTVNGVTQTKAITRQVFRAGGTMCQ
jgi:serine protease